MALPDPKLSDTSSYQGSPAPNPEQAGIFSTGGWKATNVLPPYTSVEVLQALPAPVRVTLPAASNPNVVAIGPQEYQATLSLSGQSTLQLVPGFANSQQAATTAVAPNSFSNAFSFTSRNRTVCTVNGSGLVTAVGRGEVEILVGAARQANLPLSTPAVEIYCSLNIRVLA